MSDELTGHFGRRNFIVTIASRAHCVGLTLLNFYPMFLLRKKRLEQARQPYLFCAYLFCAYLFCARAKKKTKLSPRPTARVLSATPSRFWLNTCACARFDIKHFQELNFLRVQFPSCNLFETRTCRYEWNGRENTRISRVQATTPSSEAALNKNEQYLPVRKKATPAKAARAKASTSP